MAKKRTRYVLKDPGRFFTFIACVILICVVLILMLKGCSGSKAPDYSANSSVEESSREESSSAEVSQNEESGEASRSEETSASEASSMEEVSRPEESSFSPASEQSSQTEVINNSIDGTQKMGETEKQVVSMTVGLVNMVAGLKPNDGKDSDVEKIYTVVIDPGCGGTDNGSVGRGTVVEKAINLAVALKVKDLLESTYPEISVILTRSSDVTLSEEKRAQIINEANADIAIRLHCGYFAGANEKKGVTTYYRLVSQDVQLPKEEETIHSMSKELAQAIQKQTIASCEAYDCGTASSNFNILNMSKVPTVVVQLAYLTSSEDYERVISQAGQNNLAAGIANGVDMALQKLYPLREQEVASAHAAQALNHN